eukprot:1644964-Prymnesium_polylepis.1
MHAPAKQATDWLGESGVNAPRASSSNSGPTHLRYAEPASHLLRLHAHEPRLLARAHHHILGVVRVVRHSRWQRLSSRLATQ